MSKTLQQQKYELYEANQELAAAEVELSRALYRTTQARSSLNAKLVEVYPNQDFTDGFIAYLRNKRYEFNDLIRKLFPWRTE